MEQIWLKYNTNVSYEGDCACCQERNRLSNLKWHIKLQAKDTAA